MISPIRLMPIRSLRARLENSTRWAASWWMMNNRFWAIATIGKAAAQAKGWAREAAAQTIATGIAKLPATDTAFRTLGTRRSASRNALRGRPSACRRSLPVNRGASRVMPPVMVATRSSWSLSGRRSPSAMIRGYRAPPGRARARGARRAPSRAGLLSTGAPSRRPAPHPRRG